MLVLMNGIGMLSQYLEQIPEKALEIIHATEKPTTIIYPGAIHLADNLVAEDGSIGVRITSDPFCLKLLDKLGKPIVSTSANLSGDPAPSSYYGIDDEIRRSVDLVVDWRREEDTLPSPSTIMKVNTRGNIEVIRP
jgi:L-threonylcarbamoyladenylate synthase